MKKATDTNAGKRQRTSKVMYHPLKYLFLDIKMRRTSSKKTKMNEMMISQKIPAFNGKQNQHLCSLDVGS